MAFKHGSYDRSMKHCTVQSDVVVIGGGMAGMCAAISAARGGAQVVLIQDRPVLGGNQSSEVQVGICGADCSGGAQARYVRETGILEEIWLEHMQRCSEYDSSFSLQDVLFWEVIKREKNIKLLLNTSALRANTGEDGTIRSIEAVQPSTEREYTVEGKLFIDCSGDCRIGADAGAVFRIGQEARAEFGESMAPEEAHDGTMGSTMHFRAKRRDHKVPFVKPDWAYDFPTDDSLPNRLCAVEYLGDHDRFAGFWWLEHGGCMDSIEENEQIRDELYRIVFGVWDHLKNHGDHGLENHEIVWINTMPAKRETRRLEGDYIATEQDVRNAPLFEDRVAYAGWPIDVHPPEGVFGKGPPNTSEQLSDVWSIPFRSLYSRNIPNLMMAGRNTSVSRIAMGSSRVMATCALMGQAVGTAAQLCIRHGLLPRQLGQSHIRQLQQQLLKDDCYIRDLENQDEDDLARKAKVTYSGSVKLALPDTGGPLHLANGAAQLIPVSGGKLDAVELLLRADKAQTLTLRVLKSPRINAFPDKALLLAEVEVPLSAGEATWVRFPLELQLEKNSLVWLELPGAEGVFWLHDSRFAAIGARSAVFDPQLNRWTHRKGNHAVRLTPDSLPYGGENVVNGIARPERWTNLWISEPLAAQPQFLELDFGADREINHVRLTFDTDLDTNVYLPAPYGVFGIGRMPTCVKAYELQALVSGSWVTICKVQDNYLRHRIHRFETLRTSRLRLLVSATNGDPSARVYEIRCYRDPESSVL